jgi:glycosyltransferase involved in cell wall biosynthesis
MLSADIGLVTMRPGAETVVMPSKTYSAMVAGQAILAVCCLNSDLADLVLEHDCGWVVVPEAAGAASLVSLLPGRVFSGAAGLREVLGLIASDPEQLQRKRANAYDAGHRLFSAAVVAKQWSDLLGQVAGRAPAFGARP